MILSRITITISFLKRLLQSLKLSYLREGTVDLINVREQKAKETDIHLFRLTREDLLAEIERAGGIDRVDLSEADLTGINLNGLCLDGIKLGDYERSIGADLSGASLIGVSLNNATLSYVTMRGAKASLARLRGADLRGAVCENVDFRNVDLRNVDFYRANLASANLNRAKLDGINWYLAKLDRTLFQHSYLGSKLLWEDEVSYETYRHHLESRYKTNLKSVPALRLLRAVDIYISLYANWQGLAQSSDASWAYIRARRLKRRMHLPHFARRIYGEAGLEDRYIRIDDYKEKREGLPIWHPIVVAFYLWHIIWWILDGFVELLCNYGESVWRVAGWILAMLFVIGPALIMALGGLEWTGSNRDVYSHLSSSCQQSVYVYLQYVLYTVDTFTTASFSELKPANDLVRSFSGFMALIGIFLAGLLGFVAGNRIRSL